MAKEKKKKLPDDVRESLKDITRLRDDQIDRARKARHDRELAAAQEFKKVRDAAQKVYEERREKILSDHKRRAGDGNTSGKSTKATESIAATA